MVELWRGLAKVTEECGELLQIAGKLTAYPIGPHPDGRGDLVNRLSDEIADIYASLDHFCERNGLDGKRIRTRRRWKLSRFLKWPMAGVIVESDISHKGREAMENHAGEYQRP